MSTLPRPLAFAALACGAAAAASALYHRYKPLPAGLDVTGPWRSGQVELLADLTYTAGGSRLFCSRPCPFPAGAKVCWGC
ncbi:hypothetical protein [Rothia nasimurium]|uniref:hypothetical protein n=1 Tax=Rothia nasimurium TaxID=85336 RepID=UPI001F2F5F1B|nr:hypothetical protein [Rothia nasimurium]